MFGRVSTVGMESLPLMTRVNKGASSSTFIFLHFGLGKKWDGELQTDVEGIDQQIKTGWIEVQSGLLVYPKVEIPDNIPDWCQDRGRVLIGDGTGYVGPLTIQEALKLNQVVRKNRLKETSIPNVSVSTGDLNISTATNNPYFEIISNESTKNQNDPRDLFGGACTEANWWKLTDSENYYDQNPPTANDGDDLDATTQSCSINLLAGNLRIGEPFDTFPFGVVVDIDNPNDYYVKLDCSLSSTAIAARSNYEYRYNDGDSETSTGATNIESYITLGMLNVPQEAYSGNNDEFVAVKLFGANNQAVYTYSNEPNIIPQTTETDVYSLTTKNCSIYLGSKKITFKMYGIKRRLVQEEDGGLAIPTVTVNNDEDNREFQFEITEYWPYANADGQPVWDTSTGTLVNSPLP
jgi:hypothetical protein